MSGRIWILVIIIQAILVLMIDNVEAGICSIQTSLQEAIQGHVKRTSSEIAEQHFEDIWTGIDEPSEDFGLDLDLAVELFEPDCSSEESFEPLLELSEELLPDMFYKPLATVISQDNRGFFERIASDIDSFFNYDILKSKLDAAKSKFELFVKSAFKGETKNSLSKIREKLDQVSESVRNSIIASRETRKNLKCNKRVRNCLKNVTVEFQKLERSLRNGVQTCVVNLKKVVDQRKQVVLDTEKNLAESIENVNECKSVLFRAVCIRRKIRGVINDAKNFVLKGAQKQKKTLADKTEETKLCIEATIKAEDIKIKQDKLNSEYERCIKLE